jgi:hypothetical protein
MCISYLSHCVFRLHEDLTVPEDSEDRFYVDIVFSPGAADDPFSATNTGEHLMPIKLAVPLSGRIPFVQFKTIIRRLSDEQIGPVKVAADTRTEKKGASAMSSP